MNNTGSLKAQERRSEISHKLCVQKKWMNMLKNVNEIVLLKLKRKKKGDFLTHNLLNELLADSHLKIFLSFFSRT